MGYVNSFRKFQRHLNIKIITSVVVFEEMIYCIVALKERLIVRVTDAEL